MSDRPIALGDLPPGATATVRKLSGGHNLLCRLAAMGFTPGAAVTVLQNGGRGPIIVRVRDTRVALGRGEAVQVMVEPTGEAR